MNIFKFLKICFFLVPFIGCTHSPSNPNLSSEWSTLPIHKYRTLVNSKTKKHTEYQGLTLIFKSQLTFLDAALQKEQLKKRSQYKFISQEKAIAKLSSLNETLQQESSFFLSMYMPKKKLNKLAQEPLDWSTFIRVNGEEYKGTIKLKDKLSDHNFVFFPYIEKWNKNYTLTFPVSTLSLQEGPFQVILVSPYGMARFNYKLPVRKRI